MFLAAPLNTRAKPEIIYNLLFRTFGESMLSYPSLLLVFNLLEKMESLYEDHKISLAYIGLLV